MLLSRQLGLERDINVVVSAVVGTGREEACGAVSVDSVAAAERRRHGLQIAIGHTGRVEIAARCRITAIRAVGDDVGRIGCDGHLVRQADRLPAACRLIGESGAGEQCSRCAPEISGMRAGVAGAFVKADTGDPTCRIGLEFHAKIDRIVVVDRNGGWRRPGNEEVLLRALARRLAIDG